MELACNKLASSGAGTCSPTLDASRSLNNIPDWPGFSRTRAERTKCSVCWDGLGEETTIFALGRWPKLAGNWPSFPPPGQ